MLFEVKIILSYALIGLMICYAGMLTTHKKRLQIILHNIFVVWLGGLLVGSLWLIWGM